MLIYKKPKIKAKKIKLNSFFNNSRQQDSFSSSLSKSAGLLAGTAATGTGSTASTASTAAATASTSAATASTAAATNTGHTSYTSWPTVGGT
jgi:hypothetical protein